MPFPTPAISSLARTLGIASTMLVALFGGSCKSMEAPTLVFDFHLEVATGTGTLLTLPVTGHPFLDESDVTDVKAGTIDVSMGEDVPPLRQRCVYFYFDRAGERQLELHTPPDSFGKKIFLLASGIAAGEPAKFVGVRPIDQTISDGPLFMFLEVPGADKDPAKFDALVADLKKSVDQFQKAKKSK
jgi:hypothetical protein